MGVYILLKPGCRLLSFNQNFPDFIMVCVHRLTNIVCSESDISNKVLISRVFGEEALHTVSLPRCCRVQVRKSKQAMTRGVKDLTYVQMP